MLGLDSAGIRLIDFPLEPIITNNWSHDIKHIGEPDEDESWTYVSDYFPGIIFTFTYRKRDKAGRSSLFIYITSVARLAFGNNYTPFPDIESAIMVVENRLSLIPDVPHIGELNEARFYRLDVFCHYDIGIENIENYLSIIYRTDYPHRTRGPYLNHSNLDYVASSNNGITFSTPSKKTNSIFYDKYQECGDPKTMGYLRHEVQLTSARVIENAIEIEKPMFCDINEQIADRLLIKDLEILRLNLPVSNKDYSENTLKNVYGTKAGSDLFRLMLYIAHHQTITKKEMASSLGIEVDTLQIKLNKICEAGISPYLLDEDTLLPSLSERRSLIT